MDNNSCQIDFYIDEDGVRELHTLSISEPDINEDGEGVCLVKLTPLLKKEKRIFGVDAIQAKLLASNFIKNLLGGKSLIAEDGSQLDISNLIKSIGLVDKRG
jgi:hypothetical protein